MAISLKDPGAVASIPEFAEILGVSLNTAHKIVKLGQVSVLRLGDRTYVLRKPLMEMLGAGWKPDVPDDVTKTSAKENNLAAIAAQEARETQRAKGKGGAR